MLDHVSRSAVLHYQEEQQHVPSTDKVELETRIYKGTGRKDTCVIFAHPYGPLGGNLENNVVRALFDNFAHQGYMTVRFNFRGVGRSTGRTSFRGAGEMEDVLAICHYLRSRSDLAPKRIVLCGYSYGSVAMGAIAGQVPELAGFISISYPSGVLWFLTLFNGKKSQGSLKSISTSIPKLFITGAKDNFTSEANFQKFVDELPSENKTVIIVPEANHFWAEWEDALVGHINSWCAKTGLNSKSGRSASASPLRISPGTPSPTSATSSPVRSASKSPSPSKSPGSPW
ncbi:uncharacterized protein SPPG_09026 [Spizellomyces punctatus DAOM BR117]|uniref:Xaa-Pro dipeptidyl-peptidase-like domain-containing protein n=1 Tax=Spizellomyces punctatus (strain DAOM BR117) TaxID=645134 RepID=A0A0L0HM19_SPIPD|nr:uncharacterized protein SPPG_09026 [Spizellomyces punctatus DAOM BR117]KND01965.1 hypothetical protein SPPG_09026 [Spizellomyces punctatus DAOM BR117]|eukprot:XP_016610004.1 hypothetical protein SPPG_09026 [Spizellomyces punctatus DAOM BR117]